MRSTLLALTAVTALLVPRAHAEDLQTGLAITNSVVLKALEKRGFAISDLVDGKSMIGVQSNEGLSKTAAIKPVFERIVSDMTTFKATNTLGGRIFDTSYLSNGRARFALVGVVNRMDQGYKTGNRCGETRFIYRLAYSVTDKGAPVTSRLPMTINIVMNASSPTSTCADLASAWLKISPDSVTDEQLVVGGPLDPKFLNRASMKDLEINLQMARVAASGRPDFGGQAFYLLRGFKRGANGAFEVNKLENEVDRDKLLADPALMSELKSWVRSHLREIDKGTHLIPEKFLATKAISISPGGIGRSANRLFFGFFKPEELKDISYSELEIVKSQAGLERRLNDSTCVGCHQTRAIGGFHFTGRDPYGKYPGNSVFLPGSAHFMGDLPRRHEIVEALAQQKPSIDYARGFSSRPLDRRSGSIANSGLTNGWGAHCSLGADASFKSWTCGSGLACKALSDKDSGLGICTNAEKQEIGDPCEFGKITTTAFGADKYVRLSKRTVADPLNWMCSPQSQDPGTKTGGFLNGSVRMKSTCDGMPSEAACGLLPASKPGFNQCVGKHNFGECLATYSMPVGMRGCDQRNPCRDDYICAEGVDQKRGVCISPYFLFQFRVDGHPRGS